MSSRATNRGGAAEEPPLSPYAGGSARDAYTYPGRTHVKMREALRVLDEGVHPLVIRSTQILAVALLMAAAVIHAPKVTVDDLVELRNSLHLEVVYTASFTLVAGFFFTVYALRRPRPVYLVDFATWRMPREEDDGRLCATADFFRETVTECGNFTKESVDFQMKLFERNQISDKCYFPPGIRDYKKGECEFDFSMAAARTEFERVIFSTCDELFSKTRTKPSDVSLGARAPRRTQRARHPRGRRA